MTHEEARDPAAPYAPPILPSAPAYRYRARQAFLVLLAYVGTQFVAGLVAGVGFGIWYGVSRPHGMSRIGSEVLRTATLAGGALGILAGGAAAFWLARRMLRRETGERPLALLGWSSARPRVLLFAAFVGAILALAFLFLSLAFPMTRQGGLVGRAVMTGGWPMYVWSALAVLIAPPVEEFVFRGALWTGLRRSWGPLVSGAIVTAAFVAMHLPEAWGYAPALLAITTIAILALVIRVLSGSLAPGIVLHAAYNTVIVITVLGAYG